MHFSVQRGFDDNFHTISEQEQLADARAIAALPDLLAALEAAWEAGSPFVAATARTALTKAGYTFDDSTP